VCFGLRAPSWWDSNGEAGGDISGDARITAPTYIYLSVQGPQWRGTYSSPQGQSNHCTPLCPIIHAAPGADFTFASAPIRHLAAAEAIKPNGEGLCHALASTEEQRGCKKQKKTPLHLYRNTHINAHTELFWLPARAASAPQCRAQDHSLSGFSMRRISAIFGMLRKRGWAHTIGH